MTMANTFNCADKNGSEVGVTAHRQPNGDIVIATDSGDDAITVLSAADASALATWLSNEAAE